MTRRTWYLVRYYVGIVCRIGNQLPEGDVALCEARTPRLLRLEQRVEQAALAGDVLRLRQAGREWVRAWREVVTGWQSEKNTANGTHKT